MKYRKDGKTFLFKKKLIYFLLQFYDFDFVWCSAGKVCGPVLLSSGLHLRLPNWNHCFLRQVQQLQHRRFKREDSFLLVLQTKKGNPKKFSSVTLLFGDPRLTLHMFFKRVTQMLKSTSPPPDFSEGKCLVKEGYEMVL